MASSLGRKELQSNFELIKTLSQGVEVGARKNDGELFVAHHFYQEQDPDRKELNTLFARGAGDAMLDLLNHENVVSIVTATTNKPLTGPGNAPPVNRLLWDYCDAGTLEQLLAEPPVQRRPDETGFLPESLVWHVGISMLRALQWLHEGIRDTYGTEPGNKAWELQEGRSGKYRGVTTPEKDWLPVLHRAVKPENIFFQLPRGVETYGTCKLGNFSQCYVSGNISSVDDPLIAPPPSQLEMDIEVLRTRWVEWEHKKVGVPQHVRFPGAQRESIRITRLTQFHTAAALHPWLRALRSRHHLVPHDVGFLAP